MPEFAPVINVSTLNGATGFRLHGETAGQVDPDLSGWITAGGGDVNGDGFDDLLIGAPYSDIGGPNVGVAYVVFGAQTNATAQSLATRVAAGTAYRFQGEADYDQAGISVSSAGDVNGDGFDDLLIGARFADPDGGNDRGATYLVFGGRANLEALDAADGVNDNRVALGSITPARGFRFDGTFDGDLTGSSVSGAGDVNGDGFDDLVIGALDADPVNPNDYGLSYVVFGRAANLGGLDGEDGVADGRIDLANISVGQGMRISATDAYSNSGQSVAGAGDVNGDGFDDVIVGSPNPQTLDFTGSEYLIFGRSTPGLPAELDLDDINGVNGVRLVGLSSDDRTGVAVNAAGDVNGDGLGDVVIGASEADPNGDAVGSAYVVFGRTAWGASLELGNLNGANGFRLDGLRGGDLTGLAVTLAGDVNGDGFDDLLIGARGFDLPGAYDAGAAFVVFGRAGGFAPMVDLGSLNGNTGFRIEGAAGVDALALGATGPAGDVNGDGFDDIVVGAPEADEGGARTGSTYVIYGHRAQSSVTRVGTELDNRINGGVGDDTVSGLDGDDALLGWEGDDLIRGGNGADRLDGGLDDDRLEGGSRADTFAASAGDDTVLGGSGGDALDFSAFRTAVTASLLTGQASTADGSGSVAFSSIASLRGGSGADSFTGDALANRLFGFAGDDALSGGGGADLLIGGVGRDVMTGGAEADVFDFNAATESGLTVATRDAITDFVHLSDRLDLSKIDAVTGGADNAFSFRFTGAFTAAGQVRAVQSGAHTILELNTSGASGAESTSSCPMSRPRRSPRQTSSCDGRPPPFGIRAARVPEHRRRRRSRVAKPPVAMGARSLPRGSETLGGPRNASGLLQT